jgi:hypothetical protein
MADARSCSNRHNHNSVLKLWRVRVQHSCRTGSGTMLRINANHLEGNEDLSAGF